MLVLLQCNSFLLLSLDLPPTPPGFHRHHENDMTLASGMLNRPTFLIASKGFHPLDCKSNDPGGNDCILGGKNTNWPLKKKDNIDTPNRHV